MAGIDLHSMIRQNLRDFDLKFIIKRNLCDFVNDIENFNGTLVVARSANFDNVGNEQNDLVYDIDDDHEIPRVGINPDKFVQTLLKFQCKLMGREVWGKWPGQTRPRVKAKRPALVEETQESWSFGAGVPTGKLDLQLGALPTQLLRRV